MFVLCIYLTEYILMEQFKTRRKKNRALQVSQTGDRENYHIRILFCVLPNNANPDSKNLDQTNGTKNHRIHQNNLPDANDLTTFAEKKKKKILLNCTRPTHNNKKNDNTTPCNSNHEEMMKTQEAYHVDSQLAEVRVELPRERKTDAITPNITADKGLASLM